jgi:hypothetical protein
VEFMGAATVKKPKPLFLLIYLFLTAFF